MEIKYSSKSRLLPKVENYLTSPDSIRSQVYCCCRTLFLEALSRIFSSALKIYKQFEACFSGVKTFWPVQNNTAILSAINKVNETKKEPPQFQLFTSQPCI